MLMRSVSLAAAGAALATLLVSIDAAEAACPASAGRASLDIWPRDTLKSGQTVSATHPCGKRLTCTSHGRSGIGARKCSWG
ncbi:MAG TPA: hypothetical protein PK264_09910 [Hyphomicrobiaceae bacterium]|nr:hypothetical protein [Hyphomicrobiaceae bacterium]